MKKRSWVLVSVGRVKRDRMADEVVAPINSSASNFETNSEANPEMMTRER